MKIDKLEDLKIWQLSRQLTKLVYKFSGNGDFNKDFRFRDQIRAAAGSTMDNIAEGFGRGGNKELVNFLGIARGSNEEVRSQLYRALDLNYITQIDFDESILVINDISGKISVFINYLKNSDYKGTRLAKEDTPDYDCN